MALTDTAIKNSKPKDTLRDYGGGLCEVGWSFIPARPPFRSAGRGVSDQAELNQMRAVRRARSRLRQLILSAQADHLLTLTYRENVTDFKQACKDLSRFIRAVRTHLPGWVFIAVPEKQKRGAWHWHLAVWAVAGWPWERYFHPPSEKSALAIWRDGNSTDEMTNARKISRHSGDRLLIKRDFSTASTWSLPALGGFIAQSLNRAQCWTKPLRREIADWSTRINLHEHSDGDVGVILQPIVRK